MIGIDSKSRMMVEIFPPVLYLPAAMTWPTCPAPGCWQPAKVAGLVCCHHAEAATQAMGRELLDKTEAWAAGQLSHTLEKGIYVRQFLDELFRWLAKASNN